MDETPASLDFRVEFKCSDYEIDAVTLISALVALSTAIQEIQNELQPEKKIEVKVRALQPGSFRIHLRLIEGFFDTIMQYISRSDVTMLAAIVSILTGILAIKKHLNGQAPEEVTEENNQVSLKNVAGHIINVNNRTYNIYQKNIFIDTVLSKSFATLAMDESINGINIVDDTDTSLFEASSDWFEILAVPHAIAQETFRTKLEVAELNIFKVVFQERYKWDFYYQGNRISARLKDEEFYNIIDQGESFSKGDILVAELQINQTYDATVNTYINKSYQINKVIRHIPRKAQQALPFK